MALETAIPTLRLWLKISLLRLAEGPVKELCLRYFALAASWVADDFHEEDNGQPAMTIISEEFFGTDLGGFGGFGMTVRNITDYYNSRQDGMGASVVMPHDLGLTRNPVVRRQHNADVLFLPKLRRLLLHPIRYVRSLRSLRPRFFLSIDYLAKYEYALWGAPRVPLILYIRDPRSREEWRTIGTVPQEAPANSRANARQLEGIAAQQQESFGRIRRGSQRAERKIVFATNAQFLIERACRKFGSPDLQPHYLPNPIPLPAVSNVTWQETPMFLALGRLDPQKRPWIIFTLAQRLPNVTFVLAGEVRYPQLIEPLIAPYRDLPNVRRVGLADGEAKDELLRQCWGLINTSIHEGLPVSFLEAFSYGKSVVSGLDPDGLVTRFGYFAGEHTGTGLDENTLGAFESQIRLCMADERGRRTRGEAALHYVRTIHSFENFDRHLRRLLVAEGIDEK
jgi:glycosyltransferase involved in cell wall biosynthesis